MQESCVYTRKRLKNAKIGANCTRHANHFCTDIALKDFYSY